MKLIIKIIATFFIVNTLLFVGSIGSLGFNLIQPTLKGTGVSFFDLVHGDLSQDEYTLISERLSDNASSLGDRTGAKVVSVLKQLFPDPNFSYSDLPPMEYPYPSVDEVVDANNAIAEDGAKQAIELMKQNEDDIQKAKEEGLKILQDSENENQAIKNKTLGDDNK